MIPMIKTDRGILIQFSLDQLDLIKSACHFYRLELLSGDFSCPANSTTKPERLMLTNAQKLNHIMNEIENNMKIWSEVPA